jgi:hypothetical protein
MTRLATSLPLTLVLLSGCIDVPELDAAVSGDAENAEVPNLLPIETAVATTVDPRLDGSEAEVLSRRAEALKAEAQATLNPTRDQDLDEKARKLSQRADDLRNR